MKHKALLPAYAYVRVSTDEQEDHLTSIASQISQIQKKAAEKGYHIIEMFEEPGVSGRESRRPKFLRMMERATSPEKPVKAIFANDLSRFARNHELQVTSYSRLERAGVKLILITQDFGEDAAGQMLRNITSMFDEHFSIQASKHTRRTMKANAEEGFFNGGPVPFGYEARTVEVRGKKEKRKLFRHDEEARVVELIFRLADQGNGAGPMGGRAIAEYLNENGYRLRGGIFYNNTIAGILSRPHYTGRYPNMTLDENGKKLPEEEWVWIECPRIIDPEQVARVAASRAKRSPKVTAPQIVGGPTLLVGKVRCGMPGCGVGLVVATGKSGQYRYYRCGKRTNAGASSCRCPAIRVEKLDTLVIEALEQQLFTTERLTRLLEKVMEVSDQAREQHKRELEQCRIAQTKSEKALRHLLDLVEQEIMSPRDPALAERLAEHRKAISSAKERMTMLTNQLSKPRGVLTPEKITRFADLIHAKLHGESSPLRRAYVRMFVDEIIVSAAPSAGNMIKTQAQIRLHGANDTVEKAAFNSALSKTGEVPIFDREWCRLGDSNT